MQYCTALASVSDDTFLIHVAPSKLPAGWKEVTKFAGAKWLGRNDLRKRWCLELCR